MMHSRPVKSGVTLILLLVCCNAAPERTDAFVHVCTHRSESSRISTLILKLCIQLLIFSLTLLSFASISPK